VFKRFKLNFSSFELSFKWSNASKETRMTIPNDSIRGAWFCKDPQAIGIKVTQMKAFGKNSFDPDSKLYTLFVYTMIETNT